MRCFTSYQQKNTTVGFINYYIVSLGKVIYFNDFFDIQKCFRILLFTQKILNRILSYPFFRGKENIFFANLIKNRQFIFTTFDSKGIFRKIQLLHTAKVL